MRRGDNIRQRADGRFEARYPRGRDERGRLAYGCCYGRTYEEAARKREETLRRMVRPREMNLLILGAGGHGAVIQELARSLGVFRRIAFLDDDPAKSQAIGPCSSLERYVREYPIAIPSVGNRDVRMRWLDELAAAGFVLPVLVHPTAAVSPNAEIGCGTVVEARAIVGPGVSVGRGCIISSGATIDRNVRIPDGAHIACGRVMTMPEESAGPLAFAARGSLQGEAERV